MLIDTHAHLDYPEFQDDVPGVIARALREGVTRILTIGTGIESSRRAVALAERHPEVFAVVGIHPTNVEDEPDLDEAMNVLRELARHPKVAAIGETGLDYHRLPGEKIRKGEQDVAEALGAGSSAEIQADIIDDAYQSRQAAYFVAQLDLAESLGLNVVVHQRDAWDDTLELLEPYHGRLRAVFHCFGGSAEQAENLAAHGHLVSFTGIVTFKNARDMQATVQAVAEGTYMVETDCPYLAPEPHRGKVCEPAHTRLVAEKIASLRGQSLEHIAKSTTSTAESFFRL